MCPIPWIKQLRILADTNHQGKVRQKNNIVKNPGQEDCQQSLREILRVWLIDAEEGELKLGERIVVSRGWKPLVVLALALVQAQAVEIALAL